MRFQLASLILLLAVPTGHAFLPYQYQACPFLARSPTARDATVKRLPDSVVEIEINVPGSATKAAYDKVCTEISKNIQIPGFRKGSKIPPAVLEQRMSANGGRNALKVQAINELLRQLVEAALKEESLDPIGQPTLKIPAEDLADSYKPGEELVLPVRCDVWPDIKWKGDRPYVGLTGKYARKPFNQEKMDRALADLRERYATLEPITEGGHVLAMGDACTVNMEGFMATADGEKGEPLPNAASGDRVEVVLGPGRYMEGLVEGLVGAKVGETRQISVSFPSKLRDKSLAGKKAIFDVEILEASKRIVPAVTDEFAAKVRPGLTAESLMEELKKAIDQEDAKEYTPARNKALGEALAKVVEVDVPDTLVTNQAREKFAFMMSDMRDGGVSDEEIKKQINPENFGKYKNIVKDDIIRDFKISMAADEIASLEGITVPSYQIEEQMENIRKDAAQSKENFDEAMIRAKVEATMTRQAVYDWLAENSKLEVEYQTEQAFDEDLMQKLAAETAKRELEKTKVDAEAVKEAVVEVLAEEEGGPEAQVEAPEADAQVEAPEADAQVEAPEADAQVEAPEADAQVEAPEADAQVEAPEAQVEAPEADAQVEAPEADAQVEAPEADAQVEAPEPVAENKADRYANLSLEDKAFQILKDLGLAGSGSD